MAYEPEVPVQESQKDAQKNNELPETVAPESIPVDEYKQEQDKVADKLKQFGETDLEQFLAKVTSNTIYGKQVVRKLLGLDEDKDFINPEHKTSPQELNITGQYDRSTFPAKLKGKEDKEVVSKDDAPDAV